VNRLQPQAIPYRCIKTGFYVGDQDGVTFYPFPSHQDLEAEHHAWLRSASLVGA
jgi:hypothetical protein